MKKNATTSGTEALHPTDSGRTLLGVRWFALVLTFVLGALPSFAATNEVAAKLQPARWLFVVDVSDRMGDRSKVLAGVIGELLASGINGQLKDGDQIGLWTFDKKLNAGVAPLQTWQSGQSNLVAGRSAKFVAELKYGGKSKLSAVAPELARVVKDSRRLTVLIFSEPSQTISGTPYDEELNAAYAAKKAEGSATRMPLVTVLRSEKGNLIGHSVSYAPWLVYPAFTPDPDELKAQAAANTKRAPEPRKAIIIGSEPKPVQPTTNVLVVAAPQPVTPLAEPPATPLPETTPVEPVAPPASPAPTHSVVEPAPALTATAAVVSPATVEPPKAAPAPALETTVANVTHEPVAAGETSSEGGFLSRQWLLILGLGCMWIAIVMALVLVRRSRRPTRGSLITRSLDRDRR